LGNVNALTKCEIRHNLDKFLKIDLKRLGKDEKRILFHRYLDLFP